uniref:Uncharacterized protein n=1 Tax=Lepeophtheirus salmonis TaxID=72036 RepID=A0A0K2V958_LEPSM
MSIFNSAPSTKRTYAYNSSTNSHSSFTH